ncbi:FAD-dependent oxidoreductase [Chloroflexota bacterium]
MPQMKKLFEPLNIGKVTLPNRIVMLGMTMGLSDNYKVSDRMIEFFTARAKGGVGQVTLGTAMPTDLSDTKPKCHETPLGMGIWSDEFIPGLTKLTKAIHEQGTKAACQITLHYEWRSGKDQPLEAVGPSDTPDIMAVGKVRAITTEEIPIAVEQFAEGARRAHEAGFDIIEFNAGMGYFLNRFLSPYSNSRTDKYGGSIENRLRMLTDIIASTKKKIGDDVPIICRLSGDEFLEGGNTIKDVKQMVPILEKAGIAGINLQAGWHESPRPLVQQWVPSGEFVYMAEEVKKVTSLPVITGVRIDDPVMADEIIASGRADAVGMARSLLADAEFSLKAKEGRIDDIRRCILCCRCLDNSVTGIPPDCSVNASLDMGKIEPTKKRQKVLVVGSGPSGMEAARIAAIRGHQVTLCDKSKNLGGLLILAQVLNDKLEPFVDWMKKQVKNLPIEIKLNTKVTPELVAQMKPDVIVVATGGEPIAFDVPGADQDFVISGNDIKNMMAGIQPKKGLMWSLAAFGAPMFAGSPGLLRKMMAMPFPIKKRVVIVGGQFAGLEMALSMMETGRNVTVVEEAKRVGGDIGPVTKWTEITMLKKGGVRMDTLTKVKEVSCDGVTVVHDDGKEELIPAGTIIPTLGLKENKDLATALEGKAGKVYLIGDAQGGSEIHRIREAVADGYRVGSEI